MTWKVIWQSLKTTDMRKRVFAVLGMIFVFRILAHIPVPLSDPESLQQVLNNIFNSQDTPQLLSFINVLSGGALANFSIVLAGLGPYINASIIMQLLTRAVPRLEALNKEGEYGRKKINQYTRLLTFPLAIIQSIGSIYLIKQSASSIGGLGDITANASSMQWILMVAAMTGGSMLLMWLGELITEKGIGNGISLIITIGIVSSLPQDVLSLIKNSASNSKVLIVGLVLAGITAVTMLIVKLNEASRKITINYAKRVQGNRSYGGVTTILPIKLITAGVIPIIFAVAFLSVPTFVGQLMAGSSGEQMQNIGTQLVNIFQSPTSASFQQGGLQPFIYPIAYFLLVFAFTFFYTSIAFNAKEIAENLQKQGGFIADVRSGKQTEKHLTKIVNRLTLFGAICLGLLALLPIILQVFLNVNATLSGTSILILVSVALETLRQIESRALMVTYNQYNKPDFFYEPANPAEAATGASRLSYRRFKRKKL